MHTCQTCHTPVARRTAVSRGTLEKQLHWHRVCWEAEFGPLVPEPRASLSVEVEQVTARGISAAEAYANGVTR